MTDSVEALLDLAVAALGGRRRPGQQAMAAAVARALGRGEHLLVQAGTGTGKSLAYLVPAVRHCLHGGERVVVSTATLALQRQLTARDIPLVVSALTERLPRAPRVALLKGRHNYLCRNKLVGGYPEEEPAGLFQLAEAGAADHPDAGTTPLGRQVHRLHAWAEATATGDRDELEPGVSDRAWRQVSVTARDCLGRSCPLLGECFSEQARAVAHVADVVVTNHAMLGVAAAGTPVLPEHSVLVVDEAHELVDRVTTQATAELSSSVVEQAARLARRHGGVSTDDLGAAGSRLGAAAGGLPPERITELSGELAEALVGVRDAARGVLSGLRDVDGGAAERAGEGGRKMATSAVLAIFEVAERMAGGSRADVLWCAGEGRLLAAPLAVDGLIRSRLLDGRTAVLTSATLTLGGSFGPLARSVGLTAEEPSDVVESPSDTADQVWHGVDVGSPFDHARNGILYVARDLPPPGRETPAAQLDEIAALISAAGGATLGLFSSRRAAEVAAAAMRERLQVRVLCQGEDLVPALVRQFLADDPTCLFGTLSLWQGVDLPGSTCRLVIIDRIPFPRPDDPVRSARAEAVYAAGGNGFMTVAAAHAALLLAQGSGRLIRSDTDQGVVAVLDPRLLTARYGAFLLRSMPPFWRTTDRELTAAALRRLAGNANATAAR